MGEYRSYSKLLERLIQLMAAIKRATKSPYFGFVGRLDYLTKNQLEKIRSFVGRDDASVVRDFESAFANLIGSGEVVSYATARMAFFDLMRLLRINNNHEVILLGATCSVMVNAVLRVGATPVFTDIDRETFGSNYAEIKKKITSKTRLIVAQHSFGIPCAINPIVQLAKDRNIFLLEDCALTLGSAINGTRVGNFGDASLFSTDHSKPLSTLTGGLIYTKDLCLAQKLRVSREGHPNLSKSRQEALYRRLLIEIKYCVPDRYGKLELIDLMASIRRKLLRSEGDFLIDDFGCSFDTSYPYPAKLPAFLAALGLIEVGRWSIVSEERKACLGSIMEAVSDCRFEVDFPAAYADPTLMIVPLRLAWVDARGPIVRKAIQHFTSSHLTWFLSPIVATKEPLERFRYMFGSCPVSEAVGPNMINLPCNIGRDSTEVFVSLLKESFHVFRDGDVR